MLVQNFTKFCPSVVSLTILAHVVEERASEFRVGNWLSVVAKASFT